MSRLILTLLVGVALTGCMLLPTSEERLARAAIQISTLEVIGNDRAAAHEVVRVVRRANQFVTSEEPLSLDQLTGQVWVSINWTQLTPAQAVLTQALVLSIRDELAGRIQAGEPIDPENVATVREVLGWVESAALLKLNENE